jgi:hypothetical protein
MKTLVRLALLVVTAFTLPSSALAIGSITDGGVTFAFTSFAQGNNNTSNANFTGASPTSDHLFETWWFFRVNGDTRETAFSATPTSEDYSLGNYGSIAWDNVAGRNLFDAQLNLAVIDPGTGGNLFQEMVITALANVTLSIFHYADFEVAGSAGGDTATLVSTSPNIQINVGDGAASVPWIGYGANAYKVTPYGTGNPRSVLVDMTDNGVDNLNNTGLPFAAGDFSGGFQWNFSLTAGQSMTLLTQWGTGSPLLPPSSMPTPEPGTALLMAIGLLGLAFQGRRAAKQRNAR